MRKWVRFLRRHLACAFFVMVFTACAPVEQRVPAQPQVPFPRTMDITSTVFEHNGMIPAKYTCDGEDINPPLEFSGIPPHAQSLVLIIDDPDVPKSIRSDGIWDHWVVFNIPTSVTAIEEDEQPPGVAGNGTSGALTYGGPCPPDALHRYFFKLYALDSRLDLHEGASKKDVEQAMEGHVIAHAQLIGRYERQR